MTRSRRRIFYALPRDRGPFGGIRNMFDHVRLLRAHGYDACAWSHLGGAEAYPWMPYRPEVMHFPTGSRLALDHDLVVLAEMNVEQAASLGDYPYKLAFCQQLFDLEQSIVAEPARWNIANVMVLSPLIARHIARQFGYVPDLVVPMAIDTALFHPLATPKVPRILALPRKRPDELPLIRQLFAARFPYYAEIPWDVLDGVNQAEIAAAMQRDAVFLSLSRREGLGMPPLEAMACACLVAGYHGTGGLAYATAANGDWVDDEDGIEALVLALGRTTGAALAGTPRAAERVAAGFSTAAEWSEVALAAALLPLIASWHAQVGGG